jgi:hypothetical protein
MATNGTIVGESAGVGLLEIQVEWDLSAGGQNSSVQVEEVEPSIECTGSVTLDLDLLVNGISELQAAGLQLYPNPASDNLRIDGLISWSEQGVVQCINVLGQTVIERRFQSLEYFVLPVTELPAGVFTVRLIDASEQGLESIQTSVIIQR